MSPEKMLFLQTLETRRKKIPAWRTLREKRKEKSSRVARKAVLDGLDFSLYFRGFSCYILFMELFL